MKQISTILLLFTLFSCSSQNKNTADDILPISKIKSIKSSGEARIVVFIPTLSDTCEYASMLTQGFYYYFIKGLAFENKTKKENIDVILIVNDNSNYDGFSKNIIEGMQVIYDKPGKIYNSLDIKIYKDVNSSSTVFLLDNQDKVIWKDEDYRAQGSHLKPLERKVKELLQIETSIPSDETISKLKSQKTLQLNTQPPNIELANGKKISAYKGEIVALTFYPAAFSGKFKKTTKADRMEMVYCSIQVKSFDELGYNKSDSLNKVNYFAISSSTDDLLQYWKNALGTYRTTYINDPNYEKALAFNAYDTAGYCDRVTIIIGKTGNIEYIDNDYSLEDEERLKYVIEKLKKE